MASGEGKPAIPKFASFKPKVQAETKAQEPLKTSRDAVRHREHDGARYASRAKREGKRSDHQPAGHPTSTGYSDTRHYRGSGRPVEQTEPVQHKPDFFKIDTKGDRYNVEYGAPHRYNVPSYHRVGAGRILGLPNSFAIDRESSLGTKIVVRPRGSHAATDSTRQKYSSSVWKRVSKLKEYRRIRHDPRGETDSESQQSFIPLTSSRGRKRRRLDRASSEDSGPNYRSIEGKAKPVDEPDLDGDLTSDSDLELEGEAARRRNATLSARVSSHPDDVNGWLDLINHQSNMVGTADSEGRRTHTVAEKRSIAEVKVSMYENALRKIPADVPRDGLLLGMMEEGAAIWDTKTVADKWKNVLQSNPGYIALWVKYLDFQQTRFANFTYEACRQIFLECLNINQTQPDSLKQGAIDIYILLRLSLFMREAGFCEHAFGIWQAILEFNLFHPSSLDLKSNLSNARRAFSEFWDSEIPRLGEVGAKGWGAENEPPEAKSDPPLGNIATRAIFESWVNTERYQMHYSRLPARTLDEVQEDDPYRVILSSDISDFLLFFPEEQLQSLLLDAFLLFSHLLPQSFEQNGDILKEWCEDPYVRNLALEQVNASSQWFKALSHDPEASSLPLLSSFPYSNFIPTEDSIFSDGSAWFSAFESWKSTYVDTTSSLDAASVRRTLRQLVDRVSASDTLAIYSAGLEYICNPNDAIKYAKSLLRKRPSNIGLYNAYALIESRRGREAAADKVWMTTLSMSKSFPEEVKKTCVLLWRSWIWEALNKNNASKAIQVLLAISENAIDADRLSSHAEQVKDLSPAEFLKIQKVGLTSP
ncbi:predicted protein [Uncinocarpus reesii 1704]|uniref:DUF1740-domain-containing protein n=1 Tax=Uncinocarpus reesii (strain UAMH 1704) TaxID=336963 RepID=C4JR13_UNCRE|nr:uncharacterized protein UREG_03495 [Uncinocarpus reesii 1704]EEP78649.1 predicted protein [Uncinocarpus reesii 1704]